MNKTVNTVNIGGTDICDGWLAFGGLFIAVLLALAWWNKKWLLEKFTEIKKKVPFLNTKKEPKTDACFMPYTPMPTASTQYNPHFMPLQHPAHNANAFNYVNANSIQRI